MGPPDVGVADAAAGAVAVVGPADAAAGTVAVGRPAFPPLQATARRQTNAAERIGAALAPLLLTSQSLPR